MFTLHCIYILDEDIEEFYRGKRVILTGASRGIGKSLATKLAQLGAKYILCPQHFNICILKLAGW